MKKLKIVFVVTHNTEGSKCVSYWDDYKDAFEFFERQSEVYQDVRLYREVTEVARTLLLRA
jgi:hypothetical protein